MLRPFQFMPADNAIAVLEQEPSGLLRPTLQIDDITGIIYASGRPLMGAGFQIASITLSSAQIKTLNSSVGVDIVAGQHGKMLVPVLALLQMKVGNTPYTITDPSSDFLAIGYGPPDTVGDQTFGAQTDSGVGALLTATQNNIQVLGFNALQSSTTTPIASVADRQTTLSGAPLTIWFSDANSPTDGDGTLVVTVFYAVVTLQ